MRRWRLSCRAVAGWLQRIDLPLGHGISKPVVLHRRRWIWSWVEWRNHNDWGPSVQRLEPGLASSLDSDCAATVLRKSRPIEKLGFQGVVCREAFSWLLSTDRADG